MEMTLGTESNVAVGKSRLAAVAQRRRMASARHWDCRRLLEIADFSLCCGQTGDVSEYLQCDNSYLPFLQSRNVLWHTTCFHVELYEKVCAHSCGGFCCTRVVRGFCCITKYEGHIGNRTTRLCGDLQGQVACCHVLQLRASCGWDVYVWMSGVGTGAMRFVRFRLFQSQMPWIHHLLLNVQPQRLDSDSLELFFIFLSPWRISSFAGAASTPSPHLCRLWQL
ncbi:unnamed protein product [Ostreobium quekettii]|uniref:Uncharacterized protein n=1 Tax=Ostreobium quekettii TaxID=121088 RepID=A0A8S1IY61_9CHLO|nr:unnamed protein product [Ostreobium quekettii]|eukprot:evm.model.scf_424.5 EVM.evm.TU.scf_424.5   scf_424:53537-54205(+)